MGGSNQSLFLLAGAGGLIATQGSAAVPLLILGLLLSWAAAPGWTELVLLYPNRVGGIASCCAEAFRPYSPVLANLAGTCYWWGWVPTCGVTALLSASAIHQWCLPHASVPLLATLLILAFTLINLCGVGAVVHLAMPVAIVSGLLAFVSGLAPIFAGHVNWHQAMTFHLLAPFPGRFGRFTSAMAGLYLVGFAAPAFEAATCHVGETRDPNRNVPRAMLVSAAMAAVFFVLLPLIWLGVLGPASLCNDLINVLGPTFAPLFGAAGRGAAIWFMMLSMFHGTLQPLAGASRTLSQLAEDGLLPAVFARRTRTDCPWVATLLTAGMAIVFLRTGDPPWVIAAANLTYLIGIGLPSIAVWLLRRNAPALPRPYRAPRGTIELGVAAAAVWGIATIFGFEQFGLPTVLAGLALAYSGSALYALRWWSDRRRLGRTAPIRSLHTKLTGAMLMVLALDGAGYLLAISHVGRTHTALIAGLEDIFVAVALLTITVGLVLPGMIGHAAEQVAGAADRLAHGTLADFSQAMEALGAGNLEAAYVNVDIVPVKVHSADEMAEMADSFNAMQDQIAHAGIGLDNAREGLRLAQKRLTDSNERFKLAVEGSQDGLWDWDLVKNILYFSPRWKEIIGYADDELPNVLETWEQCLHPDDRSRVQAAISDYLAGRSHTYEIEFRMRHSDGSDRWILTRGQARWDETGKPCRLAGSHTDITARRAASEELIRAKEAAEAASRTKSQFLAAISHELRTPLNAILGFSEILQDETFGQLNDRQARYVGHTLTSGQHLLELINDVLDLSKIEAGHISLDPVPCDVSLALAAACSILRTLAEKKGLTLDLEVETGLDPVWADPSRLKQVLYNLLSNAIKFTPPGGNVYLGARRLPGVLELWVRDSGIGLNAQHLERIWGEFEQVDSSYTREQQGSGLGLALSRRLIEMHHGRIWAESPGEGQGSTFFVHLPGGVPETANPARLMELRKAA